jgi:hypothetical protein
VAAGEGVPRTDDGEPLGGTVDPQPAMQATSRPTEQMRATIAGGGMEVLASQTDRIGTVSDVARDVRSCAWSASGTKSIDGAMAR